MFRGEFEHNLDEKGRILLPVKYRAELEETVILARGREGQINVYPKAIFAEMERRVEESGDAEYLQQTARFLSAASECDVDRQGRIVLPATLRRHANLSAEVIIVGNRHHVEIWNPEKYLQAYDRWVASSTPDDNAKLRELGLEI